jgi:hypothetical protein
METHKKRGIENGVAGERVVVLLELAFSGRDVDIQKFIIIVLYILIDIDKSVSWAHGREGNEDPIHSPSSKNIQALSSQWVSHRATSEIVGFC